MFNPQPKPKRKDRPGVKRKREIKKKDKSFQVEGETYYCSVGHYAEQTASHHIVGRRYGELRYDRDNTIRLCHAHHSELHQLGDRRFREKYRLA